MPEIQQSLPKYLQIARHIRDRILRGDLPPGAEVPSERHIAVDWGVSRPTATKALEVLRVDGLVDARQGSGTYVLGQDQITRRARERYQRAEETGRIYPSNERAEILAAEATIAPDHVALALGLEPSGPAVRRQRVTYRDERPVEMSTSWYTTTMVERAPRLTERERIQEGTVAYIEGATGRRGRLARDRMLARLATADECDLLALAAPAAVLVVYHLVYDMDDRPLEFVEATCPPDSWTFEQEYSIRR
jgi:GntR family transcriptional regulator